MAFNANIPSLMGSPGKPKPPHGPESSSGQVTKRLKKELMTLMVSYRLLFSSQKVPAFYEPYHHPALFSL